jgi:hypothetical protein
MLCYMSDHIWLQSFIETQAADAQDSYGNARYVEL